jgi:hypothetical protein
MIDDKKAKLSAALSVIFRKGLAFHSKMYQLHQMEQKARYSKVLPSSQAVEHRTVIKSKIIYCGHTAFPIVIGATESRLKKFR